MTDELNKGSISAEAIRELLYDIGFRSTSVSAYSANCIMISGCSYIDGSVYHEGPVTFIVIMNDTLMVPIVVNPWTTSCIRRISIHSDKLNDELISALGNAVWYEGEFGAVLAAFTIKDFTAIGSHSFH